MQQLHLVGFTTDLEGLIFSARRGSKSGGYLVVLDDGLLATIKDAQRLRNGDDPAVDRSGSDEPRDEAAARRPARPASSLSPREIQARLRSGNTVADVAAEAGVSEDWVLRWAAPILAEQARVVQQAAVLTFAKPRLGESAQPLGASVRWNLADRGIRMFDEEFAGGWSAYNLQGTLWMVRFSYRSRGRTQTAEWEIDLRDPELLSRNRVASDLGYVDPGRGRKRAPILEPPARPGPAPSADADEAVDRAGGTARTSAAARPIKPTATRPTATKPTAAAKQQAARVKAAAKKAAARRMAAEKAAAKKADQRRRAAEKAAAKKAAQRERAAAKKAAQREAALARAEALTAAREAVAAERERERAAAAQAKATATTKAAAAQKAAAKKAAAKKAAAKKAAAPQKKAPSRKAPSRKATAKQAPTKRAPAGGVAGKPATRMAASTSTPAARKPPPPRAPVARAERGPGSRKAAAPRESLANGDARRPVIRSAAVRPAAFPAAVPATSRPSPVPVASRPAASAAPPAAAGAGDPRRQVESVASAGPVAGGRSPGDQRLARRLALRAQAGALRAGSGVDGPQAVAPAPLPGTDPVWHAGSGEPAPPVRIRADLAAATAARQGQAQAPAPPSTDEGGRPRRQRPLRAR